MGLLCITKDAMINTQAQGNLLGQEQQHGNNATAQGDIQNFTPLGLHQRILRMRIRNRITQRQRARWHPTS